MELPIFTHLSPVGSYSAHYFDIPGPDRGSPLSDSDNSMDAGVREALKLKQTPDEDFFTWAGEIRVSLDEEKNYQIEQAKNGINNQLPKSQQSAQYNNDSQRNGDQQFRRDQSANQFDGQSVLVKAATYDSQARDSDLFGKDSNRQRMGKEDDRFGKSSEQYPKKPAMKGGSGNRDSGDGGARAEIDMYLEKSQMAATGNQVEASAGGKKRKLEAAWQGGKITRVSGTQGNQRDMISAGRISASWQVDDLDIDLSGELASPSYNMSEALLSLPVFKQEAPSPTGGNRDPSSPPWLNRQSVMMNSNMSAMNGANGANCNSDQQSSNVGQMGNCGAANQQQGSQNSQTVLHNQQLLVPYSSGQMHGSSATEQAVMEVASGLMLCSPQGSMEAYGNCAVKSGQQQSDVISSADNRFQYVLAAATSIATKCNEDTLTYLNQCQSYEIKLKKLGDLSHYRGKILKSIIRICFHERRLQFAEREQMSLWQSERPGERIVEVDVPLSYGLINVSQPSDQPLLNTVELYWDPVKEAGVYIKVNCISTEFTAKKHGGEKGVPFRIQVETFLPGEAPAGAAVSKAPPQQDRRLHAAACQIKVFKLKGADRKHKQDREKILRRPECERDKYQPSYECTVFTDLPNEVIFSPVGVSSLQPYSPEHCGGTLPARPSAPPSASPPRIEVPLQQLVLASPHNDMKLEQTLSRVNSHGSSLDCDEETPCKAIVQLTPSSPGDCFETSLLTEVATASETRAWLSRHRFASLIPTFANFSGADLLRLSRDDLIQICSLADGIRLYNALHAEHAPARLTLYAKKGGEKPFSAIYLRSYHASELRRKLLHLLQDGSNACLSDMPTIYVAGPNGIKIHLTDEVIQNLKNDSMFRLESVEGGILMRPA